MNYFQQQQIMRVPSCWDFYCNEISPNLYGKYFWLPLLCSQYRSLYFKSILTNLFEDVGESEKPRLVSYDTYTRDMYYFSEFSVLSINLVSYRSLIAFAMIHWFIVFISIYLFRAFYHIMRSKMKYPTYLTIHQKGVYKKF